MDSSGPSQTALSAATSRSDHQWLEKGRIFQDPIARRILGLEHDAPPSETHDQPSTRRMRLFIAARSRFAEDHLAQAVDRGLRQLVVLGAGLDTLSLRNPHADHGLRAFEVDHPATQAWKRERLHAAGFAMRPEMVFVPVDFEQQDFMAELEAHGFDPTIASFFMWLGVVPYLSRSTVMSTLQTIGRLPGAEIVFDYGEPAEARDEAAQALLTERAERVAALGEPWITFFTAEEIAAELRTAGFDEITDVGAAAAIAGYLDRPTPATRTGGGHILHARRTI